MSPHVIVVGAGIVGAACARALARVGARVTTVEAAGAPGLACSAASFGWLNLSLSTDADDLALRAEALALARAVPGFADRRGALVWKDDPPTLALFAPEEGAIEPSETAALLLADAREHGARTLFDAPVLHLLERSGTIAGVALGGAEPCRLEADHVVLAAGAACPALLPSREAARTLGLSPSVLVRLPSARPLSRILCGPLLEARAAPGGLVTAESPPADPAALPPFAQARAEGLRALLQPPFAPTPGARAQATLAQRPMPARRPFAPLETGIEGLTLAFAHPGVIFAPLLAPLLAARVASRILGRPAGRGA